MLIENADEVYAKEISKEIILERQKGIFVKPPKDFIIGTKKMFQKNIYEELKKGCNKNVPSP